jgi:hypothetical protein
VAGQRGERLSQYGRQRAIHTRGVHLHSSRAHVLLRCLFVACRPIISATCSGQTHDLASACVSPLREALVPEARLDLPCIHRASLRRSRLSQAQRIASRVGPIVVRTAARASSIYLLHPHSRTLTSQHSQPQRLCHNLSPSCRRNRALTTKTTSPKSATQTSSHHRPILPNFSISPAPVLLADSTQVQAMRRDWRESNL